MQQQGGVLLDEAARHDVGVQRTFTTVTLCCDGCTELEAQRDWLEADGMNAHGHLR